MRIRDFLPTDCDQLVEILKANDQYGHPEIDGPEAMLRVHQCDAAVFLAAEEDDRIVGFIRGIYDGSRALIHEISVHPDYQRKGVGTKLVQAISRRFKERGAPGVSVTAANRSVDFWKKLSFAWGAHLMIATIDDVLTEGKNDSDGGR